ncbi:hypothetical protein FOCC_FOCC015206 [Frankliniella occidentalis]|nr:hypothetical protein FOCC_FOCC015206 [Frankliniella occidentalis]
MLPEAERVEDRPDGLPKFAKLAKRELGKLATAAPSERVWSKTGFILNNRRNRLSPKHLSSIIFLTRRRSQVRRAVVHLTSATNARSSPSGHPKPGPVKTPTASPDAKKPKQVAAAAPIQEAAAVRAAVEAALQLQPQAAQAAAAPPPAAGAAAANADAGAEAPNRRTRRHRPRCSRCNKKGHRASESREQRAGGGQVTVPTAPAQPAATEVVPFSTNGGAIATEAAAAPANVPAASSGASPSGLQVDNTDADEPMELDITEAEESNLLNGKSL